MQILEDYNLKKTAEDFQFNDFLLNLTKGSENLIIKSKETCKEYVNSLEFSNKDCMIQNSRLIRAYEAIKEEFLEEKKVRKSTEIEKSKEIEKLRNICSEMAFDLREKTEILEEIKKKNEDLQGYLKDLRNFNKNLNENKENSHKEEKKEKMEKTKTMNFSNKFSKILENKKN